MRFEVGPFSILMLCTVLPGSFAVQIQAQDLPRPVDERLKIELFAEHPQIRTPTGIDVDHRGRVWAIESNTHFRPDEYDGHPSDRVLVMSDTDDDGRADEIVTFTDGLVHTMSVAVRPVWLEEVESRDTRVESLKRTPKPGDAAQPSGSRPSALDSRPVQVFLATRAALYLYEDTDGDLRADRRTRLVHLETQGDYPHNGLAGFAFDALGWITSGSARIWASRTRSSAATARRSPAAARAATCTAAAPTAASSSDGPPASGIRTQAASTRSAGCSRSITTPTAARLAGCCT